jgi:hypothetical protein
VQPPSAHQTDYTHGDSTPHTWQTLYALLVADTLHTCPVLRWRALYTPARLGEKGHTTHAPPTPHTTHLALVDKEGQVAEGQLATHTVIHHTRACQHRQFVAYTSMQAPHDIHERIFRNKQQPDDRVPHASKHMCRVPLWTRACEQHRASNTGEQSLRAAFTAEESRNRLKVAATQHVRASEPQTPLRARPAEGTGAARRNGPGQAPHEHCRCSMPAHLPHSSAGEHYRTIIILLRGKK